jgi:aspartate aminotransferase
MLAAWPDPGLPTPPYWAPHLAAPAGTEDITAAAATYWQRRGLHTDPSQTAAAAGGEALLLAVLTAIGGDAVVLARPAAAWHTVPGRMLGRRTLRVQTPAEGGGAPDPFALLEAVRRAREEGADPRALVLSAADDPTGTVTPPEPLHEVCEAAAEAGLLLVSDETYSDTVRHGVVLLSPAEILPDRTVVLTDLGASLVPPAWPTAIARFPSTDEGARLRTEALAAVVALPEPVAWAAAYALGEPEDVRAYTDAAKRLHAALGAAAHEAVTGSGALCRPPECGFQLYADLAPLRTERDAAGVEEWLTRRLGRPVLGGHRFGDDQSAPRVRIDVGPLCGAGEEQRRAALRAEDPSAVPHVAAALRELGEALSALSDG